MTAPAMRKLPLVLAIATIAVVAALVILRHEPAPIPSDGAPTPAASQPDETGPQPAHATTTSTRSEDVRREALPEAIAPSAPGHAWIVGRCLAAENEAPLADCVLEATWEGISPLRDPSVSIPRHLSGPDRRFRVTLMPGIPAPCRLELHHDARAALVWQWRSIAPGQVVDLGDLRLRPGVHVMGHVVDTEGEYRANLHLRMHRTPTSTAREGPTVPWEVQARVGPDGTFELGMRLIPGSWTVSVPGSELASEALVELATHEARRELRVVIVAEAPADRITGKVWDETGTPVVGVRVQSSQNLSRSVPTDDQGRFRVVRRPQPERPPVVLSVLGHREFEDFRMDHPVEWGSRDVQLVLQRTTGVEVQALDPDGKPLGAFHVQCFRHPSARVGTFSSTELDGFTTTDSKDGVVFVRGVRQGRNVLKVFAMDRERHPLGALGEFEMTARGVPRQVLSLPNVARRPVVVVRNDGAPIADSKLELVAALGPRVRLPADVPDLTELFVANPVADGLCWCRIATAVDGTAELRGPSGKTFALQLRGDHHRPMVLEGVSLDVAEPLRIEVTSGAELRGTAGPAAALATLRGWVALDSGQGPFLSLHDPSARSRVHPEPTPSRRGTPIAADGSFVIGGIPPGTWDVRIVAAVPGSPAIQEVLARAADLRDGEIRTLDLDLSSVTATRLKGQVVFDGMPLAGARLELFGEPPEKRGDVRTHVQTGTDAEGRFDLVLPPWLYGVWAHHGGPLPLPCGEGALVERGRTTERRFEAPALRIVLRVLDADGASAANRALKLSLPPFEGDVRTDAHGRVIIDPAPSFPFRVRAWPAHMNDPAARMAAQQSKGVNIPMIDLGLVTPPADRNELSVELRVPR